MKVKISKRTPVVGTISISGSKNATLPLMACALLTKEEVTLYNIPWITDVVNMIRLFTKMGINVIYQPRKKTLIIRALKLPNIIKHPEVGKIRASYYLMGSLIGTKKRLVINYPGGCNLGIRPIDYHLMAFSSLGNKIKAKEKVIIFKRKYQKKRNIQIAFPKESVGGTINTILASVKRLGTVTIINPSFDPEVSTVIEMLTLMGANIIVTNNYIRIFGVKTLSGVTYTVPFDRIEAGSYMILASLIPKSVVRIMGVDCNYLTSVINVLQKMNVKITKKKKMIKIEAPSELNGIDLEVGPYPNFPTDLQQIISILMLNASSPSTINDNIYPDRVSQLIDIKEKGAEVIIDKMPITINKLDLDKVKINEVTARDLRGGFALILLGILNKEITINHFEIIKRGYEDIENKLSLLEIEVIK